MTLQRTSSNSRRSWGSETSAQRSLVGGRQDQSIFWLVLSGLFILAGLIASVVSSTDGKNGTLPEYDTSRGDPHFRELDAYQRQWRLASSLGGTPLRDAVYRVAGQRESAIQVQDSVDAGAGAGAVPGGGVTPSSSLAKSAARRVGKLLEEGGQESEDNNKVLREIHAEALRNMERADMEAVRGTYVPVPR